MNNQNQQSKKQLPTGIQTFADIRSGDYYYVDKTPYLVELAKERAVFLSRPRRFGKSLTIDTLAELFSGNKALFTELYAEDNWDWDTKYPVIRIGFAEGEVKSADKLIGEIHLQLAKNEQKYQLETTDTDSLHHRFRTLIENLANNHNSKVVILVDEYDKPMVDNINKVVILVDEYDKPMVDNINKEAILDIRGVLRDLYSVIKGQDANIRFAMLTGVSKFSKVNIFSGLNHLNDISLDKQYSAICGYTQEELETVFAPELVDVNLAEVGKWYNGYNWSGESVYNPFDILLFLAKGVLRPYWFETGSSAWLVDNLVMNRLNMHTLENVTYSDMALADFDINSMNPIAILFQTGYLTIDKTLHRRGVRYTLKYPNIEVQQSLNQVLLNRYVNTQYQIDNEQDKLYDYLLDDDYDNIKITFQSFFASIPHHWYDSNDNQIAGYEGHWASVFYGFLTGLGVRIHTEDATNQGRMDAWFEFESRIYIIEFKVAHSESQVASKEIQAIEQIKDNQYALKFQADQAYKDKPIVLMGVVFGKAERNVVGFVVEKLG